MPQTRKFSLSLGRKHKRTIKRRKLNLEKTEENDTAPQWNWTPELEFTEQSHTNTDENTPCSSSTNDNDEWTPKESLNTMFPIVLDNLINHGQEIFLLKFFNLILQ